VNDVTLAVLPARHSGERLEVGLRQDSLGRSTLVLSQQSWSEGLGWYNQASLELCPDQVRDLKAALRVETVSGSGLPKSVLPLEADEPVSLPFTRFACAESA
jgi:hypothetical protein